MILPFFERLLAEPLRHGGERVLAALAVALGVDDHVPAIDARAGSPRD